MRSLLLSLWLLPLPGLQAPQEPVSDAGPVPAVVEHRGDGALRDRLVRAMEVWHDAGDFLVGAATPALVETLERSGTAARLLPEVLPGDELFVVDLTRIDWRASLGQVARLLHSQGGQGLVAAPGGTRPRAEDAGAAFHGGVAPVRRSAWVPVVPSAELDRLLQRAKAGGNDPRLEALVAAASKAGLQADVQMLSSNHSRNSTVSSYIDAARDQIVGRLQAMGYAPTLVQFSSQHGDNVQVEIPGTTAADEWVVIGAHYDSRTFAGTFSTAPGADDNATGSAGVLEIARVLAGAGPFERSIRLLWFAGEEYGLLGSRAAAQASLAAGERIIGMLNLDMTAYRHPGDARDVDFIINSTSAQLNELCDLVGAQYVPGWASREGQLFAGTSDHASYTAAGYPAIFPFEDAGQYSPYIHSSSDTYALSTTDFDLSLMITSGVLVTAAFLAEPADLVFVHTPLPDTPDPVGPYAVSAQVTSLIGTTVSAATMHYSADGQVYTAVPMTASGPTWSATIPSQGSPATIHYYLTASDDQGNEEALPNGADAGLEPFSFFVGLRQVLYATGFEEPDDAGWTHGLVWGPDDWRRGLPGGRAGDPPQAFEGVRVWGNDLGQGGFDGFHAGPAENWLRSPPVDCSQAANVTLSFRRWLTVDAAASDVATLRVNDQIIWKNPGGTPLIDTSWVPVTIDISSLAAGSPAVQIEFHLDAADALSYGGWNVDAFELSERSPGAGGCLPPLAYCSGKPNSRLCLPAIEFSGTPSATSSDAFAVTAVNVINNKTGVLFYGQAPDAKPFQGGTLCVAAPLKRVGLQLSGGNPPPDDCSGTFTFDFNALIRSGGDPNLVQGAAVCCQYWYRDPNDFDGFGSGLTDALRFTICP